MNKVSKKAVKTGSATVRKHRRRGEALPYVLNDFVSAAGRVVLYGIGRDDIVLEEASLTWSTNEKDEIVGLLAGWSVSPRPLRRGEVPQRGVVRLRATDSTLEELQVTSVSFK